MKSELNSLLKKELLEDELELYALIGLMSISFAKLENNLTKLLSTLIHPNDGLLAETLTEDIFLNKTIELIKKVGLIRSYKNEEIKEIFSLANSLRRERNNYVHGIWEIIAKENGDIRAICYQRKISYKEENNEQIWTRGHNKKIITIDKLRKTFIEVDYLSNKIEKLTDEILEDTNLILY